MLPTANFHHQRWVSCKWMISHGPFLKSPNSARPGNCFVINCFRCASSSILKRKYPRLESFLVAEIHHFHTEHAFQKEPPCHKTIENIPKSCLCQSWGRIIQIHPNKKLRQSSLMLIKIILPFLPSFKTGPVTGGLSPGPAKAHGTSHQPCTMPMILSHLSTALTA